MRRLLTLTLALTLSCCADALAAAGGGSSGFGGGGGGGGGGGFSGGGGGASGSSGGSVIGFGIIVLLIIAFVVVAAIVAFIAERKRRRRRSQRDRRVRTAAAEAADDDPAFAPDVVVPEATQLFVACQEAWTAGDRDKLEAMVGSELMVEWRRRLDDFDRRKWRNKVEVVGRPQVFYVGMTNRDTDDEDRVVVLIEATTEDYVVNQHGTVINKSDDTNTTVSLREYWTLAKREGRWTLLSIEQLAEGEHQLSAPLVASAGSDARLSDDARVELASGDAAAEGTDFAGLVDLEYAGDGRKQALDLSLVDDRFAPDVLEISARRALSAWAEAVDGPDAALEAVATPDAVTRLLYPQGRASAARLVVRGPQLDSMTVVGLEGQATPPTMVVELHLSGARYVENRDTLAVLSGSRDSTTRWTERWTFALDGADTTPWRLTGPVEAAAA